MTSLSEHVSVDQVECLNEDIAHPVRNVFTGDESIFLRSDCDPQLLISVPFQNPVRLNGLSLHFRPDIDAESIPSEIRLFINRVSLDFSDAESLPSIQTIYKDEIVNGKTIPLKYVSFQNVFSVQLFVVDNRGAPVSELGSIEFFGSLAENMNMSMSFKFCLHVYLF